MAAVAAAPPAVEETGFFNSPTAKTLLRSALIYFAITFVLGPNSPFKSKTDPGLITPPTAGSAELTGEVPPAPLAAPAVPLEALPFWTPGAALDVFIKLSTSVDGVVDFQDDSLPSVEWKNVPYASGKWSRDWDTFIDVPLDVQHNASLWADVFVTPAGLSPDPASAAFGGEVLHIRKALTRHLPKKKIRAVKNLMSGSKAGADVPEDEPVEDPDAPKEVLPIISYFHPNVTLEMVPASGPIPWGTLPQPLQDLVKLAHEGELNAEGKASYFPILWANDFWLMREHMNPVNETTPRLPLRITLHPSSFFKWQIMASLDDSFSKQAATSGTGGGEMDEIKRMLTETNPILLVTTVIVTILHMLFEFLAFTSDVSHWKNKKELVGVSVRTILTNCFVQLIILLYLVDQNAETSWMILGGQGIGLVIEAWKITKAVDIKVIPSVGTLIPYKLEITDKHVLTEDELKTQEYDKLAFKWVSWGTIPTLAAYTIYSMYYNEHRSWYSFVISTLTSFVYAFGFIQLIPQLIINYKLKSVAHIPMKTMTYKFFNTIVDDFFSFVIKMPLLHRLACFRDDIVFVILLYQMYIYKVDPTRANEYGQLLTNEEAAALLAANKQAAIDDVSVEEGKDKKVVPKDKKANPKTESKKNR